MITRVFANTEVPLYLEIRDAKPTDSIILEKIEGLGPPDIDLFVGDYARDGGYYSGRRVPPRTITMTLRLNPNYAAGESVASLRARLYKTLIDPWSSTNLVTYHFDDDILPRRYVVGLVEKFETEVFSNETYVIATIRCPQPYFLDATSSTIVGTGPSVPFQYTGTARTGLIVHATFATAATSVTVSLNGSAMVFTYAFQVGDKLVVDTRQGTRAVQVIRGGVTTNILYTKSVSSSWLELYTLNNTVTTSSAANITNVFFRQAYWGL